MTPHSIRKIRPKLFLNVNLILKIVFIMYNNGKLVLIHEGVDELHVLIA